jgi:hypothetical protein
MNNLYVVIRDDRRYLVQASSGYQAARDINPHPQDDDVARIGRVDVGQRGAALLLELGLRWSDEAALLGELVVIEHNHTGRGREPSGETGCPVPGCGWSPESTT